ncbi:hypothetical protein WAI453_013295 [Rhynchosporium graminicola]
MWLLLLYTEIRQHSELWSCHSSSAHSAGFLTNLRAYSNTVHGNLWSFLDVIFSTIFWVYLVLRIHSWRTGKLEMAQQAMEVLEMGGSILVPRLALSLMSENILFVSLRAMMKDFAVLTGLACLCFAGFLLSMT